jgi:3-oxoacyl-[acyl-carrier protein] reductase
MQQVLPLMMRQNWGRVVNISSLAGRNGGYGAGAHYAASKFGIVGLTMNLAKKVAMHGITINAVAPGVTMTEMIMKLDQERRNELIAMTPAGRFGTPKNIADVVTFLASDEAEYITGVVLDVNGGIFMG